MQECLHRANIFEKLCSAEAATTCSSNAIRRATQRFGLHEEKWAFPRQLPVLVVVELDVVVVNAQAACYKQIKKFET